MFVCPTCKWKYLALITLSTAFANLRMTWFIPDPGIPLVGANGGTVGIIAYYLLEHPNSKIRIFWMYLFRQMPLLLSAGWAFSYLTGLQVLLAMFDLTGGSGAVAHIAHIRGTIAGFALWLL